MPVFTYRAADRAGRTIDGVMEALDARAVVERLHKEAYFPVRVDRADARPRLGALPVPRVGARVPARDLLAFTQQLATLVEAGIPLDRTLTILGDLSISPRLRQIVQDVAQSVRSGATLADALSRHHPRPFSRLYINTIRAGEKGGALELALTRLAQHLEATRELREAITSALIYPTLLLTVGVGAVVFLLTFVLPRFAVILGDLGQALPLPTRIMLGVSDTLVAYWWVGGVAVVVVLMAWQLVSQSEAGRLRVDRWLLGSPLVGTVVRKIEVGRFARTLGTLLHSGVPLLNALDVAREVTGNRVLALALTALQEGVKRGNGLAQPMAETGAFPTLAIHMVRLGEETGRLEEMLGRVATAYEGEIRVAIRRLIALVEPVIILFLGLVVLGIVISILLAILSLNDLPL
jgi:general secretion pathway protein F